MASTISDDPGASPASAAWQRLLDAMQEAGEIVTGPLGGRTDRERAEGFRHLLRVLSVGREMLLEKGDVHRPAFTRWMAPHRKILGDNPGTYYDAAMIDPSSTYRITGTRGSCAYLGICVYGTGEGGARRIVGNLDDTDLTLDDDGRFQVWMTADADGDAPGDADLLTLEPDATDVMVRQYFLDPENEEDAEYTIELVPDAGPPPPLTEEEVARRLDAVASWLTDIVEVEASLSTLMASATPEVLRHGSDYVDRDGEATDPPVDPAVVAKAMPSPAIQYSGSWFDDLGDDEAIVVSGRAPDARYWSIQILTRWMESGDYTNHQVFLTGREIDIADDGSFEAVVSHRDPGTENWLDTTGLTSGNIAVRALLCDDLLDVDFRRESLATD